MEVVVTTEAIRRAKLQWNHHHQQTNIQFFLQAGCPFCCPTNSVEAVKVKISHSMDLLTPSSPGVFQLCLWPLIAPWGRVAMPLISPLMPVLQWLSSITSTLSLIKSFLFIAVHHIVLISFAIEAVWVFVYDSATLCLYSLLLSTKLNYWQLPCIQCSYYTVLNCTVDSPLQWRIHEEVCRWNLKETLFTVHC